MISRTTSKDATRTSRQDDGTTTTTTFGQTVVQLVKGYIGCGILSLPWAISQLGIPLGVFSIGVMSVWTSYNCWTIVQLKRYISAQCSTATATATPAAIIHGNRIKDNNNNNNNNDDNDNDNNNDNDADNDDDREDVATSRVIAIARRTRKSRTRTPSQPRRDRDRDHGIRPSVTYPELGRWAYGGNFHTYVAICVCAQQLAICTVFISFVCANIAATCQYVGMTTTATHFVVSLCLPVLVTLSCGVPSLKRMVPFLMCGTVCMVLGFATIGWIGYDHWEDRPTAAKNSKDGDDEDKLLLPTVHWNKNAIMALCGILYSYEGICIILPIESAMEYTTPHSKSSTSTTTDNNNDKYNNRTEPENNNRQQQQQQQPPQQQNRFGTAYSISVVIITTLLAGMTVLGVYVFGEISQGSITASLLEVYQDSPQTRFQVLLANLLVTIGIVCSFPLMLFPAVEILLPAYNRQWQQHTPIHHRPTNSSTTTQETTEANTNEKNALKMLSTITAAFVSLEEKSEVTALLEGSTARTAVHNTNSNTYQCFSVDDEENNVNSTNNDDNYIENCPTNTLESRRTTLSTKSVWDWQQFPAASNSSRLRAMLVIGTYVIAILVPNVESMIALVGAVTGSSTALLIPPILKLAWIRHMEKEDVRLQQQQQQRNSINNGGIDSSNSFTTSGDHQHKRRRKYKYLFDKILSWFLLIMGSIFALFGSYFSISDIIESYHQ